MVTGRDIEGTVFPGGQDGTKIPSALPAQGPAGLVPHMRHSEHSLRPSAFQS